MLIILEGILVAEGDSRERHSIEEVDFDTDTQREWQEECNATVAVIDEQPEGRHEDHEPDDPVQKSLFQSPQHHRFRRKTSALMIAKIRPWMNENQYTNKQIYQEKT